MSSTTTRLGLYKPAGDENVSVVTDLNNNWDVIDLAPGFRVVTSSTRPAAPFSGQAIAESDTSYRTYFSNGTAPASASWVEIPNSSGTFGGDLNISGDITVGGTLIRDTYESASTTSISPLVSSANTDTLVTSVSATFKDGYAYRVTWSFRVQHIGGTGPYVSYSKLRRTDASGTLIAEPGGMAGVSTNFMTHYGTCMLKRTGGSDTTQTIALCAGYSTSGSPTSMDVEAGSTWPLWLRIERIGLADDYPSAMEVPTS